ncbi:MAG: hypothetical protein IMZ55_17640 [Acidobacteria bacterium]|nr:hypothetical protein [Acidobacteriota bacterium]
MRHASAPSALAFALHSLIVFEVSAILGIMVVNYVASRALAGLLMVLSGAQS